MTQTFTCPHGTTQALIGSDHEFNCRECKSEIFSIELRTRIEKIISQLISEKKRKTISKEFLGELIDMSLRDNKSKRKGLNTN